MILKNVEIDVTNIDGKYYVCLKDICELINADINSVSKFAKRYKNSKKINYNNKQKWFVELEELCEFNHIKKSVKLSELTDKIKENLNYKKDELEIKEIKEIENIYKINKEDVDQKIKEKSIKENEEIQKNNLIKEGEEITQNLITFIRNTFNDYSFKELSKNGNKIVDIQLEDEEYTISLEIKEL